MALAAALTAWTLVVVAPNRRAPGYDLAPVIVGARVAANGDFSALYEHDPRFFNVAGSEAFRRAASELGFRRTPTPFVYPPLIAVLARPLVSLPFPVVADWWLVAMAAATVAGLAIGVRFFAPSIRTPAAWAAIVILLGLFEPIRYGLWLGQTTPLMFLLVMLALWLEERGRPIAAGAALSLPVFVKLTPVVFVLAWAWRRDRRASMALGGFLIAWSGLSVALCGTRPNLEYLRRVQESGGTTIVAYNNQSLAALLSRPGQPAAEIWRWQIMKPSLTVTLAAAAAALALVVMSWLLLRPLDTGRRTRAACGVLATLTLLIPSIAWTHYHLLLVPVGLCAWELAGRAKRAAPYRAALVVSLLLCSRPLLPDQVDPLHHPGPILGGPAFASLILWAVVVLLAREVVQPGRRPDPVPRTAHPEAACPAAERVGGEVGRHGAADDQLAVADDEREGSARPCQ